MEFNQEATSEKYKKMEEMFQQAVETSKKLFGTPVFQHEPSVRGLSSSDASGEEWDMLAEARPLDITHTVDADSVEGLLLEIIEDPPVLPSQRLAYPGEIIDLDPDGEEE